MNIIVNKADQMYWEGKRWKGKSAADKLTSLTLDKLELKVSQNRGYVIAPQKIIRCFRLSDLEKTLFLELVSYMGDNNYAFPSHNYLAFRLGKKSTTSIKQALNSLRSKGLIDWSMGGGDWGTNHYEVPNLFYNPYLIMSEVTFYCVEQILNMYRNKISYDDLYGAVLEFVEKPKAIHNTDHDIYGKYLEHLFNYPKDRDCPSLYITYCNWLTEHIERTTGFFIGIRWESHFLKLFEKEFPFLFDELTDEFLDEEIPQRSFIIDYKFDHLYEQYYHDQNNKSVEKVESDQNETAAFLKIVNETKVYAASLPKHLSSNEAFFEKSRFLTEKLMALLSDK
jgi:predicted transcriptional regulator